MLAEFIASIVVDVLPSDRRIQLWPRLLALGIRVLEMSASEVMFEHEMRVLFHLFEFEVEKQVFGLEVAEVQNAIDLGFEGTASDLRA